MIQKELQNPLASMILEGAIEDGSKITISAEGGNLTINGKAVEAEAA